MDEVWITRQIDFSRIRLVLSDFDRALLRHKPAVDHLVLEYACRQLAEDSIPVNLPSVPLAELRKALVMDHLEGRLVGVDHRHSVREVVYPQIDEDQIGRLYPGPLSFATTTRAFTGEPIHPYTTLDNTFRFADAVLFMALSETGLSPSKRYTGYLRARQHIDACHRGYVNDSQTERGVLKRAMLEDPSDFLHIHDPDLVTLFRTFREYGMSIGIISNSDEAYVRKLSKLLGIVDYIDVIVAPAGKPGYFKQRHHCAVERQFNVQPHEVLYMGDDAYQDCVAPSRYAGWNTVVLLERYAGREGLRSNPILFGKNGAPYQTHLAAQIQQHAAVIVEGHLVKLLELNLRGRYDTIHGFGMSSP